jgi:hypothetical protein
MNPATAQQIFDQIQESKLAELKRDLYQAAHRYTGMRVEWQMAAPNERRQLDASRTRAHDALIDAFNIFSREQTKHGEDNSWRKTLGQDRKELGDAAAYITLFLALSAR